jgi:hypothetical protein
MMRRKKTAGKDRWMKCEDAGNGRKAKKIKGNKAKKKQV